MLLLPSFKTLNYQGATMSLLKRFISLSLVFAISGQIMSAVASDTVPSESRQERRFFKKFDKKFTEFQGYVDDLLIEYNEVEMKEMYEEMIIYLEQHGNYEMAKVMMAEHDKAKGSIRSRMFEMSSEEARIDAKAVLKEEILKAGSFEAFIAREKSVRSKNLDKKCRAKKIASYTLIAPVGYIGLVTGVAGVGALIAGNFSVVTAAWLGTAAVTNATFFSFIDNMTVGCYNELSHPDFTSINQ